MVTDHTQSEMVTDHTQSEEERLRRLAEYGISRTPPERTFDEIVALGAAIFHAPIAFLCIAERDCHWFKARIGIDLTEVPRNISFCDHTLLGADPFIVFDASLDDRFAGGPFVKGDYHFRFYAGMPLIDSDGYKLGTLCIVDTVARKNASEEEIAALESLSRIAVDRLELRRANANLAISQARAEQAEQKARIANFQLRETIELLPEAVVLMDKENRYVLWNRKYAEMFSEAAHVLKPGISYEEFLRASFDTGLFPEAVENDEKEAWLAKRIADHNQQHHVTEQRFRDGRWIRYDQHLTPEGGRVCMRTDITDVKQREESFKFLFDHNPVPMWVFDRQSLAILAVNDAAISLYGYSREEFLTKSIVDLRPAEHRQEMLDYHRSRVSRHMDANGEIDWVHQKADGTKFTVCVFSRDFDYSNKGATLVAIVDVTERRAHEEHIRYLANHDHLTGLPNRLLFGNLLEEGLKRASKPGHDLAVLLLDIDNFKDVNDSLGHPVGDALISAAAARLTRCIAAGDHVARLGGDEFAIILNRTVGRQDVARHANRLIGEFAEPFDVGGNKLLISVSVGITIVPQDGRDKEAILTNADLALYRAKAEGRGKYKFFEPQMQLTIVRRRALEADMRQAVKDNAFELHYQPLVELQTGDITGFEALLRWHHPDRGTVAPNEFIPVAEETGLIVPLGVWVLKQACQDAITWPQRFKVAVNLSPVQFRAGGLHSAVTAALESSGLDSTRLELEITESALLDKSDATMTTLHRLRKLGTTITIDDFGTGYSSLNYLRSFPFDKIKIDRSFISDLGAKLQNIEIIRAILTLGKGLCMRVLAEGIETQEQLALLIALGCSEGQGYYFGKAQPAGEILRRLATSPQPAPLKKKPRLAAIRVVTG